jgi:DNA-binding NarL/FixJ family response regulator
VDRVKIACIRTMACSECWPPATLQAIGEALQPSPKTVSNYQTTLKHKFGASTAIELLRYARERGYVA